MIGSDPLNGGNDLSMTDPGNDVFSTIPPHKLARMGGNPLPVPIRMGKWCSFKGNRKCTRSARSPPAWPWGGYLQPPIFDLQVFSGPRCICYPMAFPGLRISIGSHRVMVGDQKTQHPLHGMPGEYPPLRVSRLRRVCRVRDSFVIRGNPRSTSSQKNPRVGISAFDEFRPDKILRLGDTIGRVSKRFTICRTPWEPP